MHISNYQYIAFKLMVFFIFEQVGSCEQKFEFFELVKLKYLYFLLRLLIAS